MIESFLFGLLVGILIGSAYTVILALSIQARMENDETDRRTKELSEKASKPKAHYIGKEIK